MEDGKLHSRIRIGLLRSPPTNTSKKEHPHRDLSTALRAFCCWDVTWTPRTPFKQLCPGAPRSHQRTWDENDFLRLLSAGLTAMVVASPGFPVNFIGFAELHAAFLNESRTRGSR